MKSIFISGISSGIGKGLTKYYLGTGHQVFGISRRGLDFSHPNLYQLKLDLADHQKIPVALSMLFEKVETPDLVILNAGVLGALTSIRQASLSALKQVMEINLWSQKVLLDFLLDQFPNLPQVIAISSGASIRGGKGWSGYSLSKAALNMLIQLYANEYTKTHFCALAPGLVNTAMQDYLATVDVNDFPSVEKIQAARGTELMPTPEIFAPKFDLVTRQVLKYPSGEFVDIRNINSK